MIQPYYNNKQRNVKRQLKWRERNNTAGSKLQKFIHSQQCNKQNVRQASAVAEGYIVKMSYPYVELKLTLLTMSLDKKE